VSRSTLTVRGRTTHRAPPPGLIALCTALLTLLTVMVTYRHGTPFALDRIALRWSLHHRPDVATALARAVTATGTGPLPYACALAAGLITGRGTRQRLWAAAGALGFLALGQGFRYALMEGVRRTRPPQTDWAVHASGFAFPSGHTTTSALVAGLLACAVIRTVRPAQARCLGALAVCWALAVGASRIYLGVHWASDVLGGWLFALTWLGLGATLIPVSRLLPRT